MHPDSYRHLRSTRIVVLIVASALMFAGGCRNIFSPAGPTPPAPVLATGALLPSPRLIVGRILAVDAAQRLAFVALASDAPNAALNSGTELTTRTPDLRETGRLEVSRYVRGQTVGAKIVGGQPSPGDEVVWLAP